MMMQTRGRDFKLVVIGDSFIGKTTMLKKYIGKFDIGRQPFVTKETERNGEKILLQIHDTMGQERFRSLTSSYYRGAHGCLLCFDVMSRSSFDDLKYWVHDIKECLHEDIPKLLVGINRSSSPKNDTSRTRRQTVEISQKVPDKNIDLFRELHKLTYTEVDLNDVAKITEVFDTLVDLVIEERYRCHNKTVVDNDIIHFPRSKDSKKESGCQC